jgi:hypothetical protein
MAIDMLARSDVSSTLNTNLAQMLLEIVKKVTWHSSHSWGDQSEQAVLDF